MRGEVTVEKLRTFIEALGNAAKGPGRVYLTGAATALIEGWRKMSVDLDLKLDPEPPGVFEAIARLKDELYAQVIPQLIRYRGLDARVLEEKIGRALARP